jgi:hypothetical protein
MTFEEFWTDRLAQKAFLANSVYEADFRMFWNAAYREGMMRGAAICDRLDKMDSWLAAQEIRSEANNEQG